MINVMTTAAIDRLVHHSVILTQGAIMMLHLLSQRFSNGRKSIYAFRHCRCDHGCTGFACHESMVVVAQWIETFKKGLSMAIKSGIGENYAGRNDFSRFIRTFDSLNGTCAKPNWSHTC